MQQLQINTRNIKEIAESIANEVANKIYYEFLFARYLPEISTIEKGNVKALEARNYLKQRIKLFEK